MATWTDIPDSVLEPGKPARSVDALALRDNPIAIAEGAAGAPKMEIYEQLFTSSGTFTPPKTGRYFVDVVGGGGNGGTGNGTGGGGGGGRGRWVSSLVNLSAGVSYPVVVAGAGGTSSVAGVSATGGGNGSLAAGGDGGGGAPSSFTGGAGGAGHFGNIAAGNGGGVQPGTGGVGYGAGGGGGAVGSAKHGGGAGAPGVVRIRW